MLTIKNLTTTCGACPSQWEAVTADDGAFVYARFRFDRLYVTVRGAILYEQDHVRNEPYAGCMSTEEMLGLAGLVEV